VTHGSADRDRIGKSSSPSRGHDAARADRPPARPERAALDDPTVRPMKILYPLTPIH
jgi:hypothetical protein